MAGRHARAGGGARWTGGPGPRRLPRRHVGQVMAEARRQAGLRLDPHKLAVLVNMMGHEEDEGANDAFRNARGLTAVTFTGSAQPISWKIQGNQGGEDITDPVR